MMLNLDPQTPMERRISAILGELIAQRQLLRGPPANHTLLASNGASSAYWHSKLHQAAPGVEAALPSRLVSASPRKAVCRASRSGKAACNAVPAVSLGELNRAVGPPTAR